jgi:PAS domain S-box-containing protein
MSKQDQKVEKQEASMGSGTAFTPRCPADPGIAAAVEHAGGESARVPTAVSVGDSGPTLRLRLTLVSVGPALLAAGVLVWLAYNRAGGLQAGFAIVLVLALAAAIARIQARAILAPLQLITTRCEQLALRHCAEPLPRTRTEMGALAVAFDAMCAAMGRSVDQACETARDEASTSVQLQRQYALMQMLRNLASMANSGEPMERALENSLREIGAYLDWPLGRLLLVSQGAAAHPKTDAQWQSHWHCPEPARFGQFIDAASDSKFAPDGAGLIGRARRTNLSHWVSDLSQLADWPQRDAALACGLRTGFIIPVAACGDTMAFVEFYSEHRIEAQAEMLELVEAISVELWRTANRYQADAALRATLARARRLASIAEAMDGAIAVTGADGRIEWVNAGMTRLLGNTATPSIGRDVPSLLFAGDPESAAECRRQMDVPFHSRGIVLPAHADDGAARWLELDFQQMPDRGDGAAGTFVLVQDITRDRNIQLALGAALQDARQASQSKSQFLANMSHEIRTPMNGVLGMAELLLGTELDDRQRRFIESLYRSGESLLDIINDILDFSKIEAGKLDLESIDFDLRSMIDDLIELLAPRAHQKRIELAYKFGAGLPDTVRGDPTRLRQVLINIIGNAIKFTERGEVVLTVEPLDDDAARADAAGAGAVATTAATRVRFTVRDTGIGMRPEAVDRLFSVFMQADQSSSRRYGGTGLGLAISRQLTELMGGNISATSRIGEGSVFRVELPLHHGDAAAIALRPLPASSIAGRRVLIAEDNPTNRQILHEQLSALDMDCALAENGRQALQMLRIAARSASPFDVAVVDMKMPILDGMALCEQVRADAALAGLRLVMLTSITGRDEARQSQAIGVDAYLAKPVRQQELVAALAAVLGSGPPQRQAQQASGCLTSLAGRRILVVEDNPVNQEVVTAMLAAFGCEARLAADGVVALDLLEREDFDAVLMDCQMPTMDGFEAMRRLRDPDCQQHGLARARHTPVIALTANALSGDAERCRAAGFSDYLAKPFRQRDLGEMLMQWVGVREEGAAGSPIAPPTATLLPLLACGATARAPAAAFATDPATVTAATAAVAAAPVLDAHVLKDILAMEKNGAHDLLNRLVIVYATSSAALLAAADQGLARLDAPAVAQALHTLKSSSANLGAVAFSRVCGRIETLARQADLASAAALWTACRDDHGAVIAALQALRPEGAAATGEASTRLATADQP